MNINGRVFRSFNAACTYYQVDPSYLYRKSKASGIPKEVLLQEKIKEGIKKYLITYNGRTYDSLSHLCKELGLDRIKVQSLIDNRGIPREEAISLSLKHEGNVPRERKGIEVIVNGKAFPSVAAACRYYDLSPTAIRRLSQSGYTYEQAINNKLNENTSDK